MGASLPAAVGCGRRFGDGAYRAATLGFGDLQDVRDVKGIDGSNDKCSAAYGVARTAEETEGSLAISGAAFTRVAGPLGNWVPLGGSYSQAMKTPVALSFRRGVSMAKKAKYIKQIPTQVMRDLNPWLREQQLPFGGARAADPGHFHIIF